MGSTNWTFSALTQHHEISAIIDFAEIAGLVLSGFEGVKKTEKNYKTFIDISFTIGYIKHELIIENLL